ncbi:hypothetical protein ACFUNF_09115 [Streptomyces sp. NPDC057291]|uniref:hypothetical protein n=1 Tax=Streptomyces sp. NPDC057291 TaxID=3346087 RepID=UPI00363A1EE8
MTVFRTEGTPCGVINRFSAAANVHDLSRTREVGDGRRNPGRYKREAFIAKEFIGNPRRRRGGNPGRRPRREVRDAVAVLTGTRTIRSRRRKPSRTFWAFTWWTWRKP